MTSRWPYNDKKTARINFRLPFKVYAAVQHEKVHCTKIK